MACPSFEIGGDAASAALRSAAPAILRGFPPPADVNFSASGSLRVDVSPAEHANIPLKLPNASLVRPAERQLPLEALIALLRDPQRPYNAYSRYLALTALPDAVRAQLPLDRLFALAGERVTAANVWLGDGGMRSDVHSLGNSCAEQGRMKEACGHFARAMSLTPRDARPYTSLGRALRADGRAAEAEAVLEAARRLGRRAS